MGEPSAKALERVAGGGKRAGAASVGDRRPGATAWGWDACSRADQGMPPETLSFGGVITERSETQTSCALALRDWGSTGGESIGDTSGNP